MPPPKPKPKSPIPKPGHKQNGLRYQPNQLFESIDEIMTWIKFSYPGKDVKIISYWSVSRIACQIEVPYDTTSQEKAKPRSLRNT